MTHPQQAMNQGEQAEGRAPTGWPHRREARPAELSLVEATGVMFCCVKTGGELHRRPAGDRR